MIGLFLIADTLVKMGVNKKTVYFIEGGLMLIVYVFLLKVFYRLFPHAYIIVAVGVGFAIFFFIRLRYLKKYLEAIK